jgi:ribosomal protein S21
VEIYLNRGTTIDKAVKILRRSWDKSGLARELRLRAIPKKSERRKLKERMALRRFNKTLRKMEAKRKWQHSRTN